MGSRLEVESEEGKGSRFFFVLDLLESTASGTDYKDHFSDFNCALYAPLNSAKAHTEFMYDYFTYFGAHAKYYTDFPALKNLIFKAGSNIIVADYNNLTKEELEEYKKIKLPIILIFKSSQQSKYNEYNTKYITPIYEPINVSKLVKALESKREFLPAKEDHIQPQPVQKATFGKKFKANVLVAEDNEINQKLIRRTLEDLGLNITIVPNGLQALERRRNETFDMIFMDIAMPVMDGIEATHKILEYEEKNHLTHTPIVAITANALKGDRERFMKEGLDEYITKPIKKESIISILNLFIQDKIDYSAQENVTEAKLPVVEETKIEPVAAQPVHDEVLTPSEPELSISDRVTSSSLEPLDVLVLKKSPIETKIFTSVLSKMCEHVEAASSYNEFKQKIESKQCKIVLFDKEMLLDDTETFLAWIHTITEQHNAGKIHTIMFIDPKEKNHDSSAAFDAILPNQISKKELEILIHTFI